MGGWVLWLPQKSQICKCVLKSYPAFIHSTYSWLIRRYMLLSLQCASTRAHYKQLAWRFCLWVLKMCFRKHYQSTEWATKAKCSFPGPKYTCHQHFSFKSLTLSQGSSRTRMQIRMTQEYNTAITISYLSPSLCCHNLNNSGCRPKHPPMKHVSLMLQVNSCLRRKEER